MIDKEWKSAAILSCKRGGQYFHENFMVPLTFMAAMYATSDIGPAINNFTGAAVSDLLGHFTNAPTSFVDIASTFAWPASCIVVASMAKDVVGSAFNKAADALCWGKIANRAIKEEVPVLPHLRKVFTGVKKAEQKYGHLKNKRLAADLISKVGITNISSIPNDGVTTDETGIVIVDGGSRSFVDEVKKAWNKTPDVIKNYAKRMGAEIVVGSTMFDIVPEWADSIYDPSEEKMPILNAAGLSFYLNRIAVAEYSSARIDTNISARNILADPQDAVIRGELVKTRNVSFVINHEIGHWVAKQFDVLSKESPTELRSFIDVYEKDKKQSEIEYKTYQNEATDRREVFADAWASWADPEDCDSKAFVESFPNSSAWMKEFADDFTHVLQANETGEFKELLMGARQMVQRSHLYSKAGAVKKLRERSYLKTRRLGQNVYSEAYSQSSWNEERANRQNLKQKYTYRFPKNHP